MRYLIPAAGMGRRMGDTLGGLPKCMIEIGGEPLIGRLLRQIRTNDPAAEIHVVLGCGSELVAPVVGSATIILNPFFDVTGIDASLWFARESFDRSVMVIHADLVLSDRLAAALLAAESPTLMAFDSSMRDPREINVAVSAGRVLRFAENLADFSGIYAGVLKLSGRAAAAFAESLDRQIRGGLHDPKAYYFHGVRALIEDFGIGVSAFDIAGDDWQEIDRPCDVAAAKARFERAHAVESSRPEASNAVVSAPGSAWPAEPVQEWAARHAIES
jgi:choline kinase